MLSFFTKWFGNNQTKLFPGARVLYVGKNRPRSTDGVVQSLKAPLLDHKYVVKEVDPKGRCTLMGYPGQWFSPDTVALQP